MHFVKRRQILADFMPHNVGAGDATAARELIYHSHTIGDKSI